jgi:hypothetical protein
MARRGVISCAISFLLLASLPQLGTDRASPMIFVAAVFLAFTSATVVSSLTALASLQCDDEVSADKSSPLAKGRALGQFRSSGQLGRALGPLIGKSYFVLAAPTRCSLMTLACASYWTFGPSLTYSASAVSMIAVAFMMRPIAKKF